MMQPAPTPSSSPGNPKQWGKSQPSDRKGEPSAGKSWSKRPNSGAAFNTVEDDDESSEGTAAAFDEDYSHTCLLTFLVAPEPSQYKSTSYVDTGHPVMALPAFSASAAHGDSQLTDEHDYGNNEQRIYQMYNTLTKPAAGCSNACLHGSISKPAASCSSACLNGSNEELISVTSTLLSKPAASCSTACLYGSITKPAASCSTACLYGSITKPAANCSNACLHGSNVKPAVQCSTSHSSSSSGL
jgi:hypothetical protein